MFKALDADANLVLQCSKNTAYKTVLSKLDFLPSGTKETLQNEMALFARYFPRDTSLKELAVALQLDSTDHALFSAQWTIESLETKLEKLRKSAQIETFKGVEIFEIGKETGERFYFTAIKELGIASADRWQVEGAVWRMQEGKEYFNQNYLKIRDYSPDQESAFHLFFNPIKLWDNQKQEENAQFSSKAYLSHAFRYFIKQGRLDWTEKGPFLQAVVDRENVWGAPWIEQDLKAFFEVIPSDCVGFELLTTTGFFDPYVASYLESKAVVRVQTQQNGLPSLSIYNIKEQEKLTAYLDESEMHKQDQAYQSFPIWSRGQKKDKKFYAIYNDKLLVSDYLTPLKSAIDQYIVGSVLAKEPTFLKLIARCPEQLSGGIFSRANAVQNLFEDANVAAGWYAWPWVAGGSFTRSGPILYEKGVETQAKSAALAWKLSLDATVAGGVRAVHFPKTDALGNVYFVQDVAGLMTCFSGEGDPIWTTTLPELLGSEIYQVDYLGSEKPFYLFNTFSKIWLLDEDGTVVKGFPMTLHAPISTGLLVTDFGRASDYVFFVACDDGLVLGFDKNGKPLEGWNAGPKMLGVKWPMQHLRQYKDDYIFMLSETGLLGAYDRFGKAHFPTIQLAGKPMSPLSISNWSGEPLLCVASQNSEFQSFALNGSVQCVSGSVFLQAKNMVTAPVHAINACHTENAFLLEKKQLGVYAMSCAKALERLGTITLPMQADTLFRRPISKEVVLLGILDRKQHWFYAVDNLGQPLYDFKLVGESPFVLNFAENGALDKILTTVGAEVWAYRVEL